MPQPTLTRALLCSNDLHTKWIILVQLIQSQSSHVVQTMLLFICYSGWNVQQGCFFYSCFYYKGFVIEIYRMCQSSPKPIQCFNMVNGDKRSVAQYEASAAALHHTTWRLCRQTAATSADATGCKQKLNMPSWVALVAMVLVVLRISTRHLWNLFWNLLNGWCLRGKSITNICGPPFSVWILYFVVCIFHNKSCKMWSSWVCNVVVLQMMCKVGWATVWSIFKALILVL